MGWEETTEGQQLAAKARAHENRMNQLSVAIGEEFDEAKKAAMTDEYYAHQEQLSLAGWSARVIDKYGLDPAVAAGISSFDELLDIAVLGGATGVMDKKEFDTRRVHGNISQAELAKRGPEYWRKATIRAQMMTQGKEKKK